MKTVKALGPFLALALLPAAAADLAPAGTLRATFLGNNPVQGRVDPATGKVTGPIADLVAELARRLNLPYVILPAPDARSVMDRLKTHTADIGFLAYDVERAAEVDYSEGYAVMYNTYAVRADSAIRKCADVDRAGVRVGAVKGQTQQLYLSSHLKQAQVKMFATKPNQAELEKLFAAGELDAFAANRQDIELAAAASPRLRALPDNFLGVDQAIVVAKGGDPARLETINRFLADVRSSGFVKASLERAKIAGVGVADGKSR